MMTTEKKAEGRVSVKHYKYYIQSMNTWMFVLVVMLFLGAEAFKVTSIGGLTMMSLRWGVTLCSLSGRRTSTKIQTGTTSATTGAGFLAVENRAMEVYLPNFASLVCSASSPPWWECSAPLAQLSVVLLLRKRFMRLFC